MKNYEYIIASLPQINPEQTFTSSLTSSNLLEEIIAQCDESDRKVIDFLLKGFDGDNLCEEFYREALGHKDKFIRDYFRLDLFMRNEKVRFLNKALERPLEKDIITAAEEDDEANDKKTKLQLIMELDDLLAREVGLDSFVWNEIEEMTMFEYFSLDAVLAIIVKLKFVDRWYSLDKEKGREMFRKLVEEIRGTFKGVEYKS